MSYTGRYTDEHREQFVTLRASGVTNQRACEQLGINRKTGDKWWSLHKKRMMRLEQGSGVPPRSIGAIRKHPIARRAYDDFAFFRLRCFGYRTPPWQVAAAEEMREAIESDRRDFVLMNVFPGAGKTSFYVHFCCWLIVRNRTIRIIWGSATEQLAQQRVNAVRMEFMRYEPGEGFEEDIEAGRAVKPTHCIMELFGRFQPSGRHGTMWRQHEFTVCTVGKQGAEEGPPPEGPTMTAVSVEKKQFGKRANFIVWDDCWTNEEERNPELAKKTRKFIDSTAESRLQPSGVFCIVMQRLGPNDLSAHVRRKMRPVRDETGADAGMEPVYRHVVFPAHHDDLCTGLHPDGMVAWDPRDPKPGQCLTDPSAIPPDDYLRLRGTDEWPIMYQQRDVDPVNALIREVYLTGGTDEDGRHYKGCLDHMRGVFEVPDIETKGLVSAMSIDVGQEKGFWGLYWSLFKPNDNDPMEWIIAAEHRRMPAGTERGLLDWDPYAPGGGRFVGVMDEWVVLSKELGIPITYVVAEVNAAQKHLFRQTNLVDRWQLVRNVRILPHTTGTNKNDPKLGIEQLLPMRYEHGAVRLPWRIGQTRIMLQTLYDEAKGYGQGHPTADVLMAQWMLWLNRRKIARPLAVVDDVHKVPDPPPAWVQRMARPYA